MKKSKINWVAIHVLFFFPLTVIAQKETGIELKRSSDETIESIVFKDKIKKTEYAFNISEQNPYNKLRFRTKSNPKINAHKVYDLSTYDKHTILAELFPNNALGKSDAKELIFKEARADSHVDTFSNYALVAYYLTVFSDEGIFGVKSKLFVINNQGKVISDLEENDQGYYEPAITMSGKHIAFNIGDVSSESGLSLMRSPEFRVCEVGTGKVIFSIPSGDYSVLAPVIVENIIIQVLRKREGRYEYYVILPDEKILFKREYTKEDIGNLLRFQINGFVFKGPGGKERLEEFSKTFTRLNF